MAESALSKAKTMLVRMSARSMVRLRSRSSNLPGNEGSVIRQAMSLDAVLLCKSDQALSNALLKPVTCRACWLTHLTLPAEMVQQPRLLKPAEAID